MTATVITAWKITAFSLGLSGCPRLHLLEFNNIMKTVDSFLASMSESLFLFQHIVISLSISSYPVLIKVLRSVELIVFQIRARYDRSPSVKLKRWHYHILQLEHNLKTEVTMKWQGSARYCCHFTPSAWKNDYFSLW